MQWPRWSEAVLALVALIVAGSIGYAAGNGGAAVAQGRLTVTASGTASVTPDQAQINLGANSSASTAQGALAKLNTVSQAIVKAVEKQGIAAQAVQTANLNVGQNYGPNGQPSGYQANEQFTITVNKLGSASAVITAAMNAGANQFNNVSFSERNPNAGQEVAIQAALKAARRQAKAEAAQLGVTLRKVVGVQVHAQGSPVPIYSAYTASKAVAPVVVPPGMQTVTVQIQVTYTFQ